MNSDNYSSIFIDFALITFIAIFFIIVIPNGNKSNTQIFQGKVILTSVDNSNMFDILMQIGNTYKIAHCNLNTITNSLIDLQPNQNATILIDSGNNCVKQ